MCYIYCQYFVLKALCQFSLPSGIQKLSVSLYPQQSEYSPIIIFCQLMNKKCYFIVVLIWNLTGYL